MSGGSYNYLERALPDALEEACSGDLKAMLIRLGEISAEHPEVDQAYSDVIDVYYTLGELAQKAKRLGPVLHAVEWRDSSDWGEDQMLHALRVYSYEQAPIRWSGAPLSAGEQQRQD